MSDDEPLYGRTYAATVASVGPDSATVETSAGQVSVPIAEWALRITNESDGPPIVGVVTDVQIIVPPTKRSAAVGSRRRAVLASRWQLVQEAYAANTPLHGLLIGDDQGDWLVDVGIVGRVSKRGLPGGRIGEAVDLLVADCQEGLNRLSLAVPGEPGDALYASYSVGDVVNVRVVDVRDFGVIVTDGTVNGLVHKSELGGHFVKSVAEVADVGTEFEAEVLSIDEERRRIAFSRNLRLMSEFAGNHDIGTRLHGIVTSIAPFGAFVEVEGVSGLLHVSQIPGAFPERVTEKLSVGQEVSVTLIDLDLRRHRVGFSLL